MLSVKRDSGFSFKQIGSRILTKKKFTKQNGNASNAAVLKFYES